MVLRPAGAEEVHCNGCSGFPSSFNCNIKVFPNFISVCSLFIACFFFQSGSSLFLGVAFKFDPVIIVYNAFMQFVAASVTVHDFRSNYFLNRSFILRLVIKAFAAAFVFQNEVLFCLSFSYFIPSRLPITNGLPQYGLRLMIQSANLYSAFVLY